jgi:hypothetical protein
MGSRIVAVALVACWLLVPRVAGRTVAGQDQAGIRGAVVDQLGNAVAQARVGVAPSGSGSVLRTTMTDSDGRFEIAGLPTGTWTLTASKVGYVDAVLGRTLPFGAPVQIPLDASQIRDVQVTMARTGAISGMTRGPSGGPVNASIWAQRWIRQNGQRQLRSVGRRSVRMDGTFRIYDLPPGRYLVSAAPSSTYGGALIPMDAPNTSVIVPRRYYPGVIDPAQAAEVVVGADEEVTGIDFDLTAVPAGTIDVEVINSTVLDLVSIDVRWAPETTTGQDYSSYRNRGTVNAGNHAILRGLPAGPHTIAAVGRLRGARGTVAPPPLWALERVETTGPEVSVRLVLQPGVVITGRYVFTGNAAPPDLSRMLPELRPVDLLVSDMRGEMRARRLPGGFEISGVPPGDYRIDLSGIPAPWSVVSAVADGQDLIDAVLVVRSGQTVDSLVVTLASGETRIEGSVRDQAGRPRFDAPVVIFPADASLRKVESRWIALAQPDIDGHYDVKGLPEGDYFVTAASIDFDPALEPDRLAALEPAARRVRLTFDAPVTQNLQVANGGGEAVFPER